MIQISGIKGNQEIVWRARRGPARYHTETRIYGQGRFTKSNPDSLRHSQIWEEAARVTRQLELGGYTNIQLSR